MLEERPPCIPVRPKGEKREGARANRPVTPGFVILFFSLVLLPFVLYYAYQWSKAGTTINTTVTTNDDLENGLVGHWTFDGPDMDWASTTAEVTDSSGNGNLGNAAGITRSSAVAGKIGQGLRFQSTNSINAGAANLSGATSVTFATWVYTGTDLFDGSIQSLIDDATGDPGSNGLRIWLDDRNDGEGTINGISASVGVTGGPGCVEALAANVISKQDWYHIAFAYNGNTSEKRIYINGESRAVTDGVICSGSGNFEPSSLNMSLGAGSLTGSLDDTRVYNRALSAPEIKRLYDLGATTHINTTIDTNDDLENGLVGHWTFDGPKMAWASSTAEVLDSSASSIEGNAVSITQQSVMAGKIGQALNFTEVGSHVNLGDINAVDALTAATFCAWVKHRTITSDDYILSKRSGAGGFELYRDEESYVANDVYQFFVMDNVASGFDFAEVESAASSTPLGRWVHVCGTFLANNATGLRLYVDASMTATSPQDTTYVDNIDATNQTVRIGGLSSFFDGQIDDVRIYNRALSATEVERLYELGATTHINTTIDTNDDLENGLVGHWTFDGPKMDWGSSTAEVLDSSASSIEGNMVNMDTTNATAGKMGQGLGFNGVNNGISLGAPATIGNVQRITLSAWVYPHTKGSSDFPTILDKFETALGWRFMLCDQSNAAICENRNKVRFIRAFSVSNGIWLSSSTAFSYNQWHHVVVSYNSSSATNDPLIYVNGISIPVVEDQAPSGSAQDDSSTNMAIGSSLFGGSPFLNFFDGSIDDVRVYNRILSPAEVKRLYELGGGH